MNDHSEEFDWMKEAKRIVNALRQAEELGFKLLSVPSNPDALVLIRYAADLLQVKHCDKTRLAWRDTKISGEHLHPDLTEITVLAEHLVFEEWILSAKTRSNNALSMAVVYLTETIHQLAHVNHLLTVRKIANNHENLFRDMINVQI